MLYGSDLGVICYIHELRKKKSGREILECISANSSIAILLQYKLNMVNDVPESK
jgi:hypothetical protein